MIVIVNWSSLKACKDANPTINIFYKIEDEYKCNDANIPDIQRYFIEMNLGGDNLECFITIEDPASADQSDWVSNYMTAAILIV